MDCWIGLRCISVFLFNEMYPSRCYIDVVSISTGQNKSMKRWSINQRSKRHHFDANAYTFVRKCFCLCFFTRSLVSCLFVSMPSCSRQCLNADGNRWFIIVTLSWCFCRTMLIRKNCRSTCFPYIQSFVRSLAVVVVFTLSDYIVVSLSLCVSTNVAW